MEVLKQPWLTRDQMHDGKARYVEMTLSNRDNLEKKITYDRKIASKTSVTEKDKENQDDGASTEDKENNDNEEDTFNWSKFVKDRMQCEQTQMILNILSDLNSHALVTLGNDQLKEEDFQAYYKIYKDYVKNKEEKIEHQLEANLQKLKKKKKGRKRKLSSQPPSLPNSTVSTPKKPRIEGMPIVNREKSVTPRKVKTIPLLFSTQKSKKSEEDEDVEVIEINDTIEIEDADDESIKECFVCKEYFNEEDLNDHLIGHHFKSQIMLDYPAKGYKCNFANCSTMIIPESISYAKHIAIDHEILEKIKNESNNGNSEQPPSKSANDDDDDISIWPSSSSASTSNSKPIPLSKQFKCPLNKTCRLSKGVHNFKVHLSYHFPDKIKRKFIFRGTAIFGF